MKKLTKRQRYVLERLQRGGYLRASVEFVHLYHPEHNGERVLMLTFLSLVDRKLIEVSGENPASGLRSRNFVISGAGTKLLFSEVSPT